MKRTSRSLVGTTALALVLFLAGLKAGQQNPSPVVAPKPIQQIEPDYTEEARKARIEGTVTVAIIVHKDGTPQIVRVVKGLGSGLDESAVAAIEKWRFQPATRDGIPVDTPVTVAVNFRLYRQNEARGAPPVAVAPVGPAIPGIPVDLFRGRGAQTPNAVVEGIVVRAGSGEPLAGAQVELVGLATNNPQPAPLTTDGQGKFSFRDLYPGTYRLYAIRNGFVTLENGQLSMNRQGTYLNVAAGQTIQGLTLPLTAAGIVSGRVTDAAGQPVVRATIHLLRQAYDAFGVTTLEPVRNASAQTDDRGEYRMFWIPPGRYYIGVNPPVLGGGPPLQQSLGPGFGFTFYPGTPDVAKATLIEVKPGSEFKTADVRPEKKPVFRIQGRVLDAQTGKPAANATITAFPGFIAPASNAVLMVAVVRSGYDIATGNFEIRDLTPGSYNVAITSVRSGNGAAPASNGPASAAPIVTTVYRSIDIVNTDVTELTFKMGSVAPVPVHVRVEGVEAPLAASGINNIRIALNPTISGGTSPVSTSTGNGTYTIANVSSGSYYLAVSGLFPSAYVKSASAGALNLQTDLYLASETAPDPIEIVIGAAAGQINATVRDRNSSALGNVEVVLIPDQRQRHDLYRSVVSDATGKVSFPGVSPGDYKIFAWEDILPNSYHNPAVLAAYEGMGKAVRVGDSSKIQTDVSAISPSN